MSFVISSFNCLSEREKKTRHCDASPEKIFKITHKHLWQCRNQIIWRRIVDHNKEIVSVCNMYVHKIRGKSHMTLHFSFLMAKYSVCKY